VRDQMRALAKLAEIDSAARDFDKELAEIPARLDELRDTVQRLESLLSHERQQLAEAESLRKQQTDEIAARHDAISKAKAKSAKARNMREADASEREVDANRRMVREREEEIARLDEAIARVKGSLEGHEKEFESLRSMFAEEEQKANERLAELQAERAKATAGRDEYVEKLPKNVVTAYDRLQQKRPPAVVDVTAGGTCQGCRLALPPQQFVELQRAEALLQCEHCRRFMTFKPIIED